MKQIKFVQLAGDSNAFYMLLAGLSVMVLLGAGAVLYVEHYGHWVTSMNNRVVWGMPHVFAIFLIIAASGALNVASVASVFGQSFYQPLSRLSALLAILLLIGGLIILVLDLGRPDRLIVAMTEYNFKSIFAWNIILYIGFIVIVGVYLWFMFERKMNQHTHIAGITAMTWRLILTTGTGSIFGFIVARQAYDGVVFAPMFIMMSLAFGLAIFILVLVASYYWSGRELGDKVVRKLSNLLGVFVIGVFYFVALYHLGSAYLAENQTLTNFFTSSNTHHSDVFWYGQILLGTLLPLMLIFSKKFNYVSMLVLASILVILGGFFQLYVIIIGGQEHALNIFPGKDIMISSQLLEVGYVVSLPEMLLGIGGVGLVLLLLVLAMKILPFLPENLPNELVESNRQK